VGVTGLTPDPEQQGPRGVFRLITEGPFAALFWAKFASSMGVWMVALAGAVVIFNATGSASVVAIISIGQFAPQLLFAPPAGKWADRYSMPRLIALGQLMCLLGAVMIPAVLWSPLHDVGVVIGILVGTSVGGIGLAVAGPSMQAIVPNIIRRGELSTATVLSMFPTNVGRLAGPAIGAVLVAWQPVAAFFVAAGLHLLAFLAFALVRFPAHTSSSRAVQENSSVWGGVAYVRHHPSLWKMLLAMFAIAVASEPAIALAPSLSEHLVRSDAAVGWLSSAFGAGALVAAVLATILPRYVSVRKYSVVGLVILGASVGLTTFAGNVPMAVACFALSGAGFSLAMAGYTTLIQSHASPQYRGRVMALWLIASVGARPLSSLSMGAITDLSSVEVAFGILGVFALGVAWVARPEALGPRIAAI
jgi:MFS family permease